MTRKQRTRVLVLGDPTLRKQLADEVRSAFPVEIVQEPRVGLVLATVRESARRSLFHLGEVLVAEAKVRVEGAIGLGLIRGADLDAAFDLAVVDAAWAASLPLARAWVASLETAKAELELALDREQEQLSATRVAFETLDTGASS